MLHWESAENASVLYHAAPSLGAGSRLTAWTNSHCLQTGSKICTASSMLLVGLVCEQHKLLFNSEVCLSINGFHQCLLSPFPVPCHSPLGLSVTPVLLSWQKVGDHSSKPHLWPPCWEHMDHSLPLSSAIFCPLAQLCSGLLFLKISSSMHKAGHLTYGNRVVGKGQKLREIATKACELYWSF